MSLERWVRLSALKTEDELVLEYDEAGDGYRCDGNILHLKGEGEHVSFSAGMEYPLIACFTQEGQAFAIRQGWGDTEVDRITNQSSGQTTWVKRMVIPKGAPILEYLYVVDTLDSLPARTIAPEEMLTKPTEDENFDLGVDPTKPSA